MLVQVAKGIHQLSIRFPFGMRQVNSYVIEGSKGVTIVDTGSCAEQSMDIWKSALPMGTKVEKVLLTHAHTDHIGLAKWLRERYDAPVLLSRLGYEEMQKFHTRLKEYKGDESVDYPYFLQHGGPAISEKALLEQVDADFFEPDELLEDEQEIVLGDFLFESIWTPGHSPDHFCFYDRSNGVLLAGDHVLNDISPLIPIWSEEEGNPLRSYFQSLDKIVRLPVQIALPGHGSMIQDLPARVAELRIGHEQRMQQILEGVAAGGSTAGEIAKVVYGLEKLSIRHMAEFLMTLSRILYLESEGRLRAEKVEGKVRFHVMG
ncbi:MBL fold metallo-hydrolase [Brevibacillus choshinensis]|uniref:MBL fold metallo-hydrolase n=1 Tax=Brevibacillus choshinensis TaxID=54911 RepID=A0ABX7FWT7_BRECH|nr:MBL fold metallo-hydrolase [Brevibacillus choshinensis]QRG70147.1 MBL fold metallo-hydrolase [Brevibacillus choshinensis]